MIIRRLRALHRHVSKGLISTLQILHLLWSPKGPCGNNSTTYLDSTEGGGRSPDSVSYRYVGIHVEIKRHVPMFQKVQRSMSKHRKTVLSWCLREVLGFSAL